MTETVEQLRIFMESEFRHRDEMRKATETAADSALKIAQATLTDRLDHSNGMKEMLKDNVALMMPRADTVAAIQQLKTEVLADLAPLNAKVDAYGRPNISLMTAAGSFLIAVIGGAWLIFGLEIRAEIAPLTLSVEQIKVSNAGRDAQISENRTTVSRLEQESSAQGQRSAAGAAAREALTKDVRVLQENFTQGRATRAAIEATTAAKMTEIETQFCASDIVRNLLHATDMRNMAMLWHKAFPDTTMVTDNAYYPRVCNRGAQ